MAKAKAYLSEERLKNLVSEVETFKASALSKRKKHELNWQLARRMVAGDQWIRINGDSSAIEPAPVGKKPKIVDNVLLPARQARLAHILKNKPRAEVTPASGSEEDRAAARVGMQVAEHYFRQMNWQRKVAERAGPEMEDTGNVFFKLYWNPLIGKEIDVPVLDPKTGQLMQEPETDESGAPLLAPDPSMPLNPDGTPVMVPQFRPAMEKKPRGEPVLDVVVSEELLLDPGAVALEDCRMVVHWTLKPVDEMKLLVPEAKAKIRTVDQSSDFGKRFASLGKASGLSTEEIGNRCEVKEVWAVPDEDKGWPQGLHAIIVNEEVIKAEPTPPGHEHIPFVQMIDIPLSGDIYGTSPVIQAAPLQKALNLSVSRDQYRRNVQRPLPVATDDAGIDEDELSNDDKELLTIARGSSFEWKSPPAYSDDKEARNYYREAINAVFMNANILMGDVAGETRSGRQVWMQTENAGVAISGPTWSIEAAAQWIGNALLKMLRMNAEEEREIHIIGEDHSIEVKFFKNSDLEGVGDYFVVPGSALPLSMSQKQQMLLDVMDRYPEQRGKLMKLLPFPGQMDGALDDSRVDRDRANEENETFAALTDDMVQQARALSESNIVEAGPQLPPNVTMMGGMPPPPLDPGAVLQGIQRVLKIDARPDFENNAVHLEVHNSFRKSRKYRALPESVKALVDEHADMHLEALAPPVPAPGAGPMGAGKPGEPEPAGDKAAGMSAMPPTPTPGNHARG
jgi:hypothetical protein